MNCSMYNIDWEIEQIELAIKYHQTAIGDSLDLDDKLSHFDKLSELKNKLNQLKTNKKNERNRRSV